MAPFESFDTVSYLHSIVYGSVLYKLHDHFRDQAIYWWKIAIFSYLLAFDALVRGGGSRRNIAIPFGVE